MAGTAHAATAADPSPAAGAAAWADAAAAAAAAAADGAAAGAAAGADAAAAAAIKCHGRLVRNAQTLEPVGGCSERREAGPSSSDRKDAVCEH